MDFGKLAEEGVITATRDKNDEVIPPTVYESWDDVEKRIIKMG